MFHLERKRIFLTGGTGFFGKSILSMIERGFLPETEFVVLSRNPQQFLVRYPGFARLQQVAWVAGDIRDFVFPEGNFDAVIHAATPAVTGLPSGEMRSIIIDGTRRVIAFSRRCGVRKLMLTSSGAVYGVQPPELERIPEDFPCNPVTEYGIAKLEAEKMCVDSGIYTMLPRCFAFVGPYLPRDEHFAIGNFIRDALAGMPIRIKGDGTPLRSYLYADDLVEWLFSILNRGKSGIPYNVGSDQAISILDLAKLVKSTLNSSSEIEVVGRPQIGMAPSRYIPDIRRSREAGLAVKVPLDDAVRKSLNPTNYRNI